MNQDFFLDSIHYKYYLVSVVDISTKKSTSQLDRFSQNDFIPAPSTHEFIAHGRSPEALLSLGHHRPSWQGATMETSNMNDLCLDLNFT